MMIQPYSWFDHCSVQVILALTERKRCHIPYRTSKLTHILKDSLGGRSRTVLITNVWSEKEHIPETLSTCRFGQRIRRVHNEVAIDVVHDESDRVKQLERYYYWSEMGRRLELWRVTKYIIFGYFFVGFKMYCNVLSIVLNILKVCGTNGHSIQFWFYK